MQGSRFRVQGSGYRVQGAGCRVQGSGFRVQGAGFRVQGSGSRVQGSGFRVQGAGSATNPFSKPAEPLVSTTLRERYFFIDNLLLRLHHIILMISVEFRIQG